MLGLASCSNSKLADQAEDALDEAGTELAEEVGLEDEGDDEFSEDGDEVAEEGDDEFADEDGEEIADEEVEVEDDDAEVVEEDISPSDEADDSAVASSSPAPSMEMTGSDGWYTVQRGDTLMIIAFKIYGDYDRWRSLASWNSGKLGPNYSVSVGQQLKYDEPAQKFEWNPSGNPYLIRSGDTLGTISRDTYGSMGYWKNIWNNNRPLIKDPNRIFAGFTIYTPVIENRGLANTSEDI